ncbi:hypothetical protein BKA62DRAFT_830586 [Auriculariales sp. MPI-PUGE-AT-0066]|nr:hypothetical protein BKA62DRAFT_830586 [Auriculariales sp. MPI-PUGE-AT-0066]
MEHLMWPDDREGFNVLPGASVPSDWCLGPKTATGEIDYADLKLPTPAPDNELSLDTLAPANLVGAGTGLGPRQQPHTPVPFYPFQGQSNSVPGIGGSSFAYNVPPQNPSYLPGPWYMQGLGASSSNLYGTLAPVQFPQYYPQPAPFPQWDTPASGPPYYQYDVSSLSSNGQYHPSAMAAAPPSTMGNFRGPMSAASSSIAPRTGTKCWMSAELAENGVPDLTTSKYARLTGQPSRINKGCLKRSPLGEITAALPNTMARQDFVAKSSAIGPEYVRPIAGKKRGKNAKQSAAAASPADISIPIPSKEENVDSRDQKQPTPTSASSLSPEPVVPTAVGLANIPAPSTSSSPKPQETMPAVAKYACDRADGCSSDTTSIEPIDNVSGAQDGRDVSQSLESVVGQAVTPANEEVLPVVSDEESYSFPELFPDATAVDAETSSEPIITADPTAASSVPSEAVLRKSFNESERQQLTNAERIRLTQLPGLGLTDKNVRAWYKYCRGQPYTAFVRGFVHGKPDVNGKFTGKNAVRLGTGDQIHNEHQTRAA